MSRHHSLLVALLLVTLISQAGSCSTQDVELAAWPGGLIIDHTCIDLDSIPSEWIDAAQDNVRVHYAHTSHGGQITTGLSRIEASNSTYDSSIGNGHLPADAGTLCILDGNPPESYITPDLYWQGASARALTQNTIDNNPTITVSLWSWCTQLNYYDAAGTQEYLDAMTMLENANPDITFIYMTSNAQAGGGDGYNRWVNNQMVRQYCLDNDKILFDFADLDCWSGGVHSTYTYESQEIPIEHEDFNGNEAGHTTFTSCEQKGRAFWWMMARLAGWNDPPSTSETTSTTFGTTSAPTSGLFPFDLSLLLGGLTVGLIVVVGALLVKRRR